MLNLTSLGTTYCQSRAAKANNPDLLFDTCVWKQVLVNYPLLGPCSFQNTGVPGTMGEEGHVITPAGLPNGIMFVARRAGRATIDLVAGDWRAQRFFILDVVVEAGDAR
ncbi:hypothetical protein [Paraburkholderia caribensis]|uniref:hypothetical protein n=1 Tax=Paraburkholderia caribensis TaxID=75105 RepID=UPI000AA0219D|nr:hypothetical protein [Paraburkholderia caribensis]